MKGYKPRKGNSNPLQVWGLRLLVVGCLGAFGWLWWQEGPSAKSDPKSGDSRRRTLRKIDLEKLPRLALSNPAPARSRFVSTSTNRVSDLPPTGFIATNPPSATATPQRPLPATLSPASYPRTPVGTFEIQLALARQGINAGPIDGAMGSQTRAAIRAFQAREKIPQTGTLDAATAARLQLSEDPRTSYVITDQDVARLRPLSATWLGKSNQDRLDYETLLELVAEKFWASQAFIRQLNPGLDWTRVRSGSVVIVPNVGPGPSAGLAAFIRISLSSRHLEVFGESTNLMAHFPCSIAQSAEKRPVGQLEVQAVIRNPNYQFDPANFPTSPEASLGKLMIPPGPNNPVGTVWISLSRPGYGIHGTPKPEEVGRTGSLGCFRLANWNAEALHRMAWMGMPVYVDP